LEPPFQTTDKSAHPILPDRSARLVDPGWVGQLSGYPLLSEALVLMFSQQMPFTAVARAVSLTWQRAHAICSRYVELVLAAENLWAMNLVAVDETSYRRGHEHLRLVADMQARPRSVGTALPRHELCPP